MVDPYAYCPPKLPIGQITTDWALTEAATPQLAANTSAQAASNNPARNRVFRHLDTQPLRDLLAASQSIAFRPPLTKLAVTTATDKTIASG